MENKVKKISSFQLKRLRAKSLNELFDVAQAVNKWIEENNLSVLWLPAIKHKFLKFLESETGMTIDRICNLLEQLCIFKQKVPVSKKAIKRIQKREKRILKEINKSKPLRSSQPKEGTILYCPKNASNESAKRHFFEDKEDFFVRDILSVEDIYEINEKSYKILKNLPSSFSEAFDYLITQFNITEEELSEKTNISVRTISELRNKEKEHVKLETVIKLCIGLNLDICICDAMIRKSGNIFGETQQQLMYKRILYYAPILTIEECNKLLSRAGFKEL